MEVETFVGSASEGFTHRSNSTHYSAKAVKFKENLKKFAKTDWAGATGGKKPEDLHHSETSFAFASKKEGEGHLQPGQKQVHAMRGRLDMCDFCFKGFEKITMKNTKSTFISYTGGSTFRTNERWAEAELHSVQHGQPGLSVQRPEEMMKQAHKDASVARADVVKEFRPPPE
ncbi:hypothetical protein M0D69_35670 [Caballeronia sp. SEWSISQ10-4 2]|uniref:hypothetical protein n=1 Tax=Caballeronia sp. SEWSISQ10-4 2 TaxID=2937438 RepID=UPI00264D017C|nr:hypothetical protein [Caballeronia sp. SEWSISQ10-4 2]MDN7183263.1 hypothetical protein [Caballeronia sp. SEWSISQ10-4 2]